MDWNLYKKSRNICNNKIKNAKYKYHQELLNETARDPKKFWKILKNIFSPENYNIAPYSSSNHEQQTKANRYCSFFSSIAINIKKSSNQIKDYVWRKPTFFPLRTTKVFKFGYVSKIFVEKQLKLIKRKKATGVDNLPPGFLKDAATVISQPLCHIINLSLSSGIVPNEWKIAKVTPLFKSGNEEDCSRYHPISVLSHSKL